MLQAFVPSAILQLGYMQGESIVQSEDAHPVSNQQLE
jgi:hypothetical protein